MNNGTTPAITGSTGPGQFFGGLRKCFFDPLKTEGMLEEQVIINTRSLTFEGAIGITEHRDFPVITGKNATVQAECIGALGQAFTDAPSALRGALAEIRTPDIQGSFHDRGLFIVSLNTVMRHLGEVGYTIHCRNNGPEQCAVDAAGPIEASYGHPRIGLTGYQPPLLERLSDQLPAHVVDLGPIDIGRQRYGVSVEDGRTDGVSTAACDWANLVLCTDNAVCNGSIVNFLHLKDKVLLYGITSAGVAVFMGLPRICSADRYQ